MSSSWVIRLIIILFAIFAVLPVQAGAQQLSAVDDYEYTNYVTVKLTTDLNKLTDNQKEMLPLLIEAVKSMDDVFWQQACAINKERFLKSLPPERRAYGQINYGPWDRLQNNQPFLKGFQSKPAGANFYPADITKEEFERSLKENPADADQLKNLYTLVRRNADTGKLTSIPYNVAYKTQFNRAANYLRDAAELADDLGFKKYLMARAEALLSNEYRESDMLWMDMKTNGLDVVIGPIETYEDQLFGYKAAAEGYVLVKDMTWSDRLSKYAAMLPDLQKSLPVDEKYKAETPGTDSDLNAYDVIYYAGDCNSGSKTIAINLPNDEEVQLKKGSRRLQLKNTMRAKFDKILVPISELLIVPEQRKHITFNAFFANTMFHEVAHGLGIKNTITGNGRVREALREAASGLEEGKADVLGLFMVTQLLDRGEITEGQLEDYYVTFMTSIFRSVRFGASSAHGKANMLRFNFFKELGAFTRDENGRYRVDMAKMKVAMEKLSQKILQLQGDGDYGAARKFTDDMGYVGAELRADLDRVNRAGVPTDIVFRQGVEALGLR